MNRPVTFCKAERRISTSSFIHMKPLRASGKHTPSGIRDRVGGWWAAPTYMNQKAVRHRLRGSIDGLRVHVPTKGSVAVARSIRPGDRAECRRIYALERHELGEGYTLGIFVLVGRHRNERVKFSDQVLRRRRTELGHGNMNVNCRVYVQ